MSQKSDGHLPLSPREKEIITLAASGQIDKEIAERLGVSVASVRTYWERLRTKLGAANRAHAIALGMPHNRLDRLQTEISALILRNIEDEAIFVCDEAGTMLTWNKGVEAVFGYTESEWIGKHVSIFFIPADKDQAERELADAGKAGASVNFRWHVRKDGTRFWGANTVLTFDPPHNGAAYAKIVRPQPYHEDKNDTVLKQAVNERDGQ
jgi:PAS domain S-box-containing protein